MRSKVSIKYNVLKRWPDELVSRCQRLEAEGVIVSSDVKESCYEWSVASKGEIGEVSRARSYRTF